MNGLRQLFDRPGEAGFTLLECLVIFVLMGATAAIVSLTLTSAPTFMFRSVTHEVEIRRVQTCLAAMDAAYRPNRNQGDWKGMAAVIAVAQLNECRHVTVQFEGSACACTDNGTCTCKQPGENGADSRPDLLVVRLGTPSADVVRFYAK